MRKIAIALATAAALLAGPSLEARSRLTPQQELDKLTAGRVPGQPVHCLSNFQTREMRVLDKTAIVYGWGNTIWVNVPRNAQDLDDDNIVVTRSSSSELCDLDIVTTVDRSAGMFNGTISLGQFVPYRRVASTR